MTDFAAYFWCTRDICVRFRDGAMPTILYCTYFLPTIGTKAIEKCMVHRLHNIICDLKLLMCPLFTYFIIYFTIINSQVSIVSRLNPH